MLEKMKVQKRLALVLVCALLGVFALLASVLHDLQSNAEGANRMRIQHLVQSAVSQAGYYVQQEAAGKLTREQAQNLYKESLRAVRFGADDYFFIYDLEGKAVMVAGKPDIEGKVMLGKKDAIGTPLWDLIVAAGKGQGSKFIDYAFPRAGQQQAVPKLAYVEPVGAWGWIVGTGVYTDDIAKTVWGDVVEYAMETLVIALFVGGVGFFVARSVLRQLGGEPAYAAAVMSQVAAGDLAVEVRHDGRSDSLLGALAGMTAALRTLVADIGASARQLSDSAARIAAASGEVAESAQVQADSTSAMAAAVEEMTVSVTHISDSARETEGQSATAAQRALDGQQRAGEAGRQITRLETTVLGAAQNVRALVGRAQEVGSITQVIKDIASQTNLLALNAAIEAARAGEQGRGFAVVADEVRGLAERTASATVQIEQMIAGIQQDTTQAVQAMEAVAPQVQDSVAQVKAAADALEQIHAGAGATLQQVREVAAATSEQSAASTSIAQQVEQIAQRVESTSRLMRGTAQAAGELDGLARELSAMVGRFRV